MYTTHNTKYKFPVFNYIFITTFKKTYNIFNYKICPRFLLKLYIANDIKKIKS